MAQSKHIRAGPRLLTLSQDFEPFGNRMTGTMKVLLGREHVVKKSKFTEDQIAFALKGRTGHEC